ncbi:MAG: LytTR family DNA-binding domain-containing protein [Oricola sp.]
MKSIWKRKAVTLGTLVAVATLTGPFGTYLELDTVPRFAYWLAAAAGCGFFMNIGIYFALTHPQIGRFSALMRLAAAVLIAAIPGALVIMILEFLFRGTTLTPVFAAKAWSFIAIIGFVIAQNDYREFLSNACPGEPFAQAFRMPADSESAIGPGADEAVFFRHLKPQIGRRLVSLSMHDHYLEVVTDSGRDMILKRMGDAVAELVDYPGLQIHRSHWVALDAVADVERENGKTHAVLRDGRKLPVSRARAGDLRDLLAGRPGA